MEGIWTNYPMFEITLQQAFKPVDTAPTSTASWWTKYGTRRYGAIGASV